MATNNNTGTNSINNANSNCQNDLTVNDKTTGSINNNVNVDAKSGAANVSGNTNGGNAISGDATAELNIMNLINTAIGAGQTFFGMINIFGNLNGDILFPQGFLNSAIAGSGAGAGGSATVGNGTTGPNSLNNANANNTNNVTVNNSPSASFNNDVKTSATSGNANVANNTNAGSATTGATDTNNSTFNLFNTSIFGDNAVLVLVNVMGHWMGQIMNLGSGGLSTAALLTGNATVSNNNTGPNSRNNANANDTNNLTVNNSPTGTINNHITATAQSGDANVTDNTQAGDAKSGAAKVASNVANFFGSTLNLKKWFGILVINVFGDWTGDVNQNTSAGDPAASPQVSTVHTASASPATVGHASGGSGSSSGGTNNTSHTSVLTDAANASTQVAPAKLVDHSKEASTTHSQGIVFVLAAATLLLAGGLFSLDSKLRKAKNK